MGHLNCVPDERHIPQTMGRRAEACILSRRGMDVLELESRCGRSSSAAENVELSRCSGGWRLNAKTRSVFRCQCVCAVPFRLKRLRAVLRVDRVPGKGVRVIFICAGEMVKGALAASLLLMNLGHAIYCLNYAESVESGTCILTTCRD